MKVAVVRVLSCEHPLSSIWQEKKWGYNGKLDVISVIFNVKVNAVRILYHFCNALSCECHSCLS